MGREFTTDDEDKSIVMADGTHIGTVSTVRDGQAHLTLDDSADLTEVVKSTLGWEDTDDTHELQHEDVDEITEQEIRLRSR